MLFFIPNGKDLREKDNMKAGQIWIIFLATIGLNIIINSTFIAVTGFFTGTGMEGITTTSDDLLTSGIEEAFAGLLLLACVAGFGEEFLFRKLLYKKMAGCPDILYILISGITFGIMHSHVSMGFGHIVTGMMFAYIYLRTKSYLTVALLHTLIDTMTFFVFPLLTAFFGLTEFIVIIPLTLQITGIFVLIYFVIFYRKKMQWNLQPATEAGWEFASGKLPLRAALLNPGMAIFTIWCLGTMIYNLLS